MDMKSDKQLDWSGIKKKQTPKTTSLEAKI